jgi:predicted  nucleic acid-binding Zn-ribbon protein
MAKVTNELIYDVLKQLQSDVSTLKHGQQELKDAFIIVREDIHGLSGDIHGLSGRVLALEKSQNNVEQRLARIEKRLDLVEA